MNGLTFAGVDGILVLIAYAVIMLVLGYLAGRGKKNIAKTNQNYYLAGGGLGFVALLFTLYATQYSGNAIIGYAPTAYRTGFGWWQSVPFMVAVIAAYLLFAPRLYVIAKKQGFVTPTDWIRHRFASKKLMILVAVLMLWGLANYLLEQLVAMGQGVSGLTGDTVPYQVGVVAFVLVMLIYSWTGGMRAVAYTDIMQGIAMLLGIGALLFGSLYLAEGGLPGVLDHITATEPAKAGVPTRADSVSWLSMIVLVGLGAAVYPHAIQRVYAARSERTLKRSLAIMAWMPLLTTGVVFVIGIVGIQLFPGLSEAKSEQLVGMIANEVAGINMVFYLLMILLFGGVVAAIVSTADSALLAFSSIVSRDVYGRSVGRDVAEEKQVRVGKFAGVAAVGALLMIALNPPGTLLSIFVLKFELIVQLAPAFILGLYWKRMAAGPTFWGMLVGAATAGVLAIADLGPFYGVPGGIVGLTANVVVCVIGSLLVPPPDPAGQANQPTQTDVAQGA